MTKNERRNLFIVLVQIGLPEINAIVLIFLIEVM